MIPQIETMILVRRSFAKPILIWTATSIFAVLIAVVVFWRYYDLDRAFLTFVFFAGSVTNTIEVLLSALAIKTLGIRTKVRSAILGGMIGFLLPITFFMMYWALGTYVLPVSWTTGFVTEVGWAMLLCAWASVPAGMAGGAWFGLIVGKS